MKRLLAIGALSAAFLFCSGAILQAQEKAPAESAEKSGSMPEPDPIWRWANFAILVVGLGYLVAKTVPPMFRSRSTEIQKGIAEAQKVKQEADKRAAAVEARMKTLGTEIEQFRTNAKAEMQQEGERIRQETADQIARLEQRAAEEIDAAGKTAQRELKVHAAALALQLAEQRLRAQVGAGTQLVDGFVKDLGRLGQETRN
jgi:F-type H+-transporting ATPase subunit b